MGTAPSRGLLCRAPWETQRQGLGDFSSHPDRDPALALGQDGIGEVNRRTGPSWLESGEKTPSPVWAVKRAAGA